MEFYADNQGKWTRNEYFAKHFIPTLVALCPTVREEKIVSAVSCMEKDEV